eukprot:2677290-Pleurochrysis_carterae.AAC.2
MCSWAFRPSARLRLGVLGTGVFGSIALAIGQFGIASSAAVEEHMTAVAVYICSQVAPTPAREIACEISIHASVQERCVALRMRKEPLFLISIVSARALFETNQARFRFARRLHGSIRSSDAIGHS